MIDEVRKQDCTGCSACLNICPVNAIGMPSDSEGFQYPRIDYDVCIKCEACARVCPILSGQRRTEERLEIPEAKAAWSKDHEIRVMSTSGGGFTELAMAFLRDAGYVVGAIYNESFQVEHFMIASVDELPRLRQSKYVQSDKRDIFQKVKKKLQSGARVLFVGAPCEVGGLYNFLEKPYEHLVTIDYICLGTNSPKIYNHFLDMLRERYQSEITRVWFKNKEKGWNSFCTRVDFENGKHYLKNRRHDYFMRGYIGPRKYYTRPCCEYCRYKEIPRQADITLADFWGIARLNPAWDEDLGTSAVLLNSLKGRRLYWTLQERVQSYDVSWEHVSQGNGALTKSVTLAADREDFFQDLDYLRFDHLIDKYCKKTLRQMFVDLRADIHLYVGKKERL